MTHASLLLVEEVPAAAASIALLLLVVVALLVTTPASLLGLAPRLLLIPTSLLLVNGLWLTPRLLVNCLLLGINRSWLDNLRLLNSYWLWNYLTGLSVVRGSRGNHLWLRNSYRNLRCSCCYRLWSG